MNEVSIVIPTWNSSSITARCLQSISRTAGRSARVIVVDNASRDGILDVIQQFSAELNIECVRNDENLGFAKAVNRGIKMAPEESDIILMNNDVIVTEPFWIEQFQAAAYRDKSIGILGCRLIDGRGKFLHAGVELPSESYWAIEVGGGEKDINQHRLSKEVEAVTFAVAYLKRKLIRAIGLLDETFFAYFEDVDYCIRARGAGFKVFYFADLTCVHSQGASTKSCANFLNQIYRDSQARFMEKWGDAGSDLGIVWHSITNIPTGYSLSSLNILKHLSQSGIDVRYKYIYGKDTIYPHPEKLCPDPVGLAIQSKPLVNYPLQVTYSQADHFYKNFGRYKVGFSMFEADGLPEEWVRQCNEMDEVWVPSSFNRETFRDAGVSVPIHTMPLGISTGHFNPHIQPQRFSTRFTFLSILEWSERKGQEVLIRAFMDEFAQQDDVLLVLKVMNQDYRNNPYLELARLGLSGRDDIKVVEYHCDIQAAQVGTYDRERVVILYNGDVPYYQLGCLYRGCDCFVLPTRGEGWGLPVMEAMACAVPVIATGWSALRDFFDEDTGYVLNVQRMVPARTRSPYYEGLQWAEPDYEHLRSLMRHVFEHQDEAASKAEVASEFVMSRFDWHQSIQPMVKRIREIYDAIL